MPFFRREDDDVGRPVNVGFMFMVPMVGKEDPSPHRHYLHNLTFASLFLVSGYEEDLVPGSGHPAGWRCRCYGEEVEGL